MRYVITILSISLLGCGGIPFDKCTQNEAKRCNASTVEFCADGYWYPQLDCESVEMVCDTEAAQCK